MQLVVISYSDVSSFDNVYIESSIMVCLQANVLSSAQLDLGDYQRFERKDLPREGEGAPSRVAMGTEIPFL
jgi:sigma54-dependent transcription regulator